MATYFIDPHDVQDDTIVVTGELRHHLADVLRLHVGNEAVFADNCGTMYHTNVISIQKAELRAHINRITGAETEPLVEVWLLQGLPKGDKIDTIVRQCTELGVAHIVPLLTDRCEVRLNGEKAVVRAERCRKIAAAAAEQCGRGRIPTVAVPCALVDALAMLPAETQCLFFYEGACEQTYQQALHGCEATSYALIIGPEGGFSQREANLLKEQTGYAITMGQRILRTETAGTVALAALLYEKGEGR